MDKKQNSVLIFVTILLVVLVSIHGCISVNMNKNKISVFHAGSLSGPFSDLESEFENNNDDIDIQRESAGSAEAIRKITELGKTADVLASADYTLIEEMMLENDPQYANWYIQFAVNQLVIAYTDKSTAKDEITSNNWPMILKRSDVNLGFSNPNLDPCGYRALMMLQLAEDHYGLDNFFQDLIIKHTSISIDQKNDDIVLIKTPENLEPDSSIMIRPKEVDLMVQLESAELDYLIIYKSVAYQHRRSDVKFITLPDEIDLSNPDRAADYANVSIDQFSDLPGKEKRIVANPIIYGITIPLNAANPKKAEAFIKMLLGEKGQDILNQNGQPPLVPARVNDITLIPDSLKEYVVQL